MPVKLAPEPMKEVAVTAPIKVDVPSPFRVRTSVNVDTPVVRLNAILE
jgi:hypothetical protein